MGGTLASLGAAWLLVAAAPAHANSAAPKAPHASAVEEVLALERARNEAIQKGDAAALAAMTSDDYTFITIRGELRTKSEIVKGFATGSFKYDWRQISDLKVRIYGDTAIVTGRASQKGVENQRDYSGAYKFTRVYVRQKGNWKTVALQTTLEAPD
jgi:ketosteroid isomerase-like protein